MQRLALAYAPASARGRLLALLALDLRLAAIVRSAREPMLAQLRLAWWREQLSAPPVQRQTGEPLLMALADWPRDTGVLARLADGWEAMTGQAPLPAMAIETLAGARAEAFAALAEGVGARAAALQLGRGWALADIAGRLSDPAERDAALGLARSQDWRWQRLPRSLRPLAVLHAVARSNLRRGRPAQQLSPVTILLAVRMGLAGR